MLQQKKVFENINQYIQKYNSLPSKEAISIAVDKIPHSDEESKRCQELIEEIFSISQDNNDEWIINESENFCKEKAVYNAILESIHIIDGKSQTKSENAIPSILSDALAVSFDNHIGHDYLQDYEERYEFYHQKEEKIPFDLEFFNKITKGGLPNKTLNIALAGTGVGKSLFMCHCASAALSQGKNVLYITMEMAEEKIAERIDSNLLNVNIKDLVDLPKQLFSTTLEDLPAPKIDMFFFRISKASE